MRPSFSILFFSLLITSCSLPSRSKQKDLLESPSLALSQEEAIERGVFEAGGWPAKEWWEMFDSKELSSFIEIALQDNPTIKATKERITYAKEVAVIKRSKLFPLVYFDYNENWQYLSENGLYHTLNPTLPLANNLLDFSLSFDYEFDFWGKIWNTFKASIDQAKAAEAETAEVELIISTAVAQGYYALKTNLLRQKLYEELYRVRKELFFLQDLLQKSALASKFPVYLSIEVVEESEKLLASIREEVLSNYHLLNALMGRGADEPIELEESLDEPAKKVEIPETLSIDLLARRPDLMAQIWRAEAYAREVGAAMADFLPAVNLKGIAGFESLSFQKLFNMGSRTGSLLPAIHLPIFTAGAIGANVRAKKALFDEAIYAYNTLLLKSAQEVADLLVVVDAIYKKRDSQKTIVKNSSLRYELTELRRKSGLDNLLSSYEKKEELLLKELDDMVLLYNQYFSLIKLVKALGGGYSSPEIPIEKERCSG